MRIIAVLTLVVIASVADAQQVANKTVTDVREVMREHDGIAEINLWPCFDLKKIPVAVYDSVNTWLFFADQPPEGFRKAIMIPESMFLKAGIRWCWAIQWSVSEKSGLLPVF